MVVLVLNIALLSAPAPAAAGPSQSDLKALLIQVDESNRGQSSRMVMRMHVKTKRFERSMKMEGWSKGSDYSLTRFLEPAKDRGMATLKVKDKLWNYLPNTDRTMRVPSAMMSGSYMGSHITNDDLVQGTRLSEDYTYALAPGSAVAGQKTIRCTPKPKTPVVWGYIDVVVTDDGVPIEQVFYSEKKVKVRTMTYTDVKVVGGKKVPHRMRFEPHDKPGEFTEIIIEKLELGVALEAGIFSLQALRD